MWRQFPPGLDLCRGMARGRYAMPAPIYFRSARRRWLGRYDEPLRRVPPWARERAAAVGWQPLLPLALCAASGARARRLSGECFRRNPAAKVDHFICWDFDPNSVDRATSAYLQLWLRPPKFALRCSMRAQLVELGPIFGDVGSVLVELGRFLWPNPGSNSGELCSRANSGGFWGTFDRVGRHRANRRWAGIGSNEDGSVPSLVDTGPHPVEAGPTLPIRYVCLSQVGAYSARVLPHSGDLINAL